MSLSFSYTRVATPLGPMLLTASADALVAAHFVDQGYVPAAFRGAASVGVHPVLAAAASALARYFAGDALATTPPLVPSGTLFQRRTWSALAAIPAGTTRSYRDIALALGMSQAARAVGTAIGRNPLAIFIPCHRVIGSDGTLTGYAGGLDRKRALLALEHAGSRRLDRAA